MDGLDHALDDRIEELARLLGVVLAVTCLRSPSSAAFEVRIFSAKCRGVYALGESKRAAGEAAATPACPVA
jgi:hypothetical protein